MPERLDYGVLQVKVIILGNQSRAMSLFWRSLAGAMLKRNFEVVFCAPAGDEKSDRDIAALGARLIHYHLDRKGLNPFHDLKTLLELKDIFRREKPDILFGTTIKPVIYGCMAAHWQAVPRIFATITGLGYTFETDTLLKKILNRVSRFLYRMSLRHAHGIFFQNRDDADLFRACGILSPDDNIMFAAGTGVDTSWFAPAPFPPLAAGDPIIFLLVGRLLEAKGLREYIGAAGELKKKYPFAIFQLLGPMEHGPGSMNMKEIERADSLGVIQYLGETRDVRPFVAASHVAVLPSWREGVPTSLMEAMSMGRPCVATGAPGCREVVKDGLNGYLVESRNATSLARGMEKFLLAPDSIAVMGGHSRALVLEQFDAEKVAEGILDSMLKTFPA